MNVVQQMTHPMIEEMQVRYEREIAELRSQMQSEIDEVTEERDFYKEKSENAESAVFSQERALTDLKNSLEKIKKGDLKKGIEPRKITIEDLRNCFSEPSLRYDERDYAVLEELSGIFDMIEENTVYIEKEVIKERIETVYEIPPEVRSAMSTFKGILEEYV